MDLAALAKLPLAERLQAMELLWETLRTDDAPEISPEWHAPLLRERRRELESSPSSPVEDVATRLRKKFGY